VEGLEERCLQTGGLTYYDLPPDDAIGPSAFHVGPDHTVYLADVLSATIARVSSDGQVQDLAINNAYTGEMEFGPDGNLVSHVRERPTPFGKVHPIHGHNHRR
jgi:hypothetical protein